MRALTTSRRIVQPRLYIHQNFIEYCIVYTTMAAPQTDYPRPDFQRSNLQWQSLNGSWDFIFDDDDVGLAASWQANGLPASTTVSQRASSGPSAESDTITQKIVAGTQDMLKQAASLAGSKTNEKRTIKVPFVFQCPASGINERGEHEVLWYERSIQDPRSPASRDKHDRVLLRFGAVDYEATIWLDGALVGTHAGGHVPFDVDLTSALNTSTTSAQKRLTIRVYDSAYDLEQPRGKQYWGAKPESIFYTPSSGIWQNVWLEVAPRTRLADSGGGTILRSDNPSGGQLNARVAVLDRGAGHPYKVELESSLAGVKVGKTSKTPLPNETNYVKLDLHVRLSADQQEQLPADFIAKAPLESDRAWDNGTALWSTEHPTLYDLTLRLYDSADTLVDEVETTTGMRSLTWTGGDSVFRLNGKPLFQSLVLDQGYWPETFMTPPSSTSCKEDIQLSQAMGFNGCRKHQKVEDPLFNYWADRLGYLVWGEIANGYKFGEAYVQRFDAEWAAAVRRDLNHPSVVTWTPVNESWAYTDLKNSIEQRNHIRSLYYATKTLDPSRAINDNCGWEHVMDDLTTFHDYADAPQLSQSCASMTGILASKADRPVYLDPISDGKRIDQGSKPRAGAPVLCTEFGGVNIAPGSGDKAGERDWGYTTASNPADLLKRIEALMMGIVNGGHICGFVYTQLADIEQEVNGLYSFDRKEKLDSSAMRAIQERARKAYYDRVGA